MSRKLGKTKQNKRKQNETKPNQKKKTKNGAISSSDGPGNRRSSSVARRPQKTPSGLGFFLFCCFLFKNKFHRVSSYSPTFVFVWFLFFFTFPNAVFRVSLRVEVEEPKWPPWPPFCFSFCCSMKRHEDNEMGARRPFNSRRANNVHTHTHTHKHTHGRQSRKNGKKNNKIGQHVGKFNIERTFRTTRFRYLWHQGTHDRLTHSVNSSSAKDKGKGEKKRHGPKKNKSQTFFFRRRDAPRPVRHWKSTIPFFCEFRRHCGPWILPVPLRAWRHSTHTHRRERLWLVGRHCGRDVIRDTDTHRRASLIGRPPLRAWRH